MPHFTSRALLPRVLLAILAVAGAAPAASSQVPRPAAPPWELYVIPPGGRHVRSLAFDRRARRSVADTLYAVIDNELYRITPGGLAIEPVFNRPGEYLAITGAGEILTGGHWDLSRSTDGGRTWQQEVIEGSVYALLASNHPASDSAVFVSTFGTITNARSLEGGAAGSWQELGPVPWYPLARFHAYGELPPSRGAPFGRLLAATGGIVFSDDGGRTWTHSNTMPHFPNSPQRVGVEHIAVAADGQHPFGGTAYAVGSNYAEEGRWSLFASEDGGRTWSARRTFWPGDFGRQFQNTRLTLAATPSGVIYVGIRDSPFDYGPDGRMGLVICSTDGGQTWEEWSSGLDGDAITTLALGRDGHLYAGTMNLRVQNSADVWRTAAPVVVLRGEERVQGAVEATSQSARPGQRIGALRVAPSPATGAIEVTLSLPENGIARISIHDALGRQVALVHDGALQSGASQFAVDCSDLTPGIYLVRAVGHGFALTETVTIAR